MNELVRRIVIGGLTAGTIDIGAPCLIYHVGPAVVLRSIAAGLMGESARHGGASVVLLGLGLHLLMSLLIAAFYGVAGLRLRFLLANPITWGLLYGIGIFVVMNYVVMPLSAIGHRPHFTPASFVLNLLAMLVFGWIVAFAASFQRRSQAVSRLVSPAVK